MVTGVQTCALPISRGERSLRQFLLDGIAQCPPLAERLQDAQIVHEPEATGNFSYLSERTHGRNYVLLGDAFAFIDPVFSSGVLLRDGNISKYYYKDEKLLYEYPLGRTEPRFDSRRSLFEFLQQNEIQAQRYGIARETLTKL